MLKTQLSEWSSFLGSGKLTALLLHANMYSINLQHIVTVGCNSCLWSHFWLLSKKNLFISQEICEWVFKDWCIFVVSCNGGRKVVVSSGIAPVKWSFNLPEWLFLEINSSSKKKKFYHLLRRSINLRTDVRSHNEEGLRTWDHSFRLYTAIEDSKARIEGTRNSTLQLLCFVDAAVNTATALSRDVHLNC